MPSKHLVRHQTQHTLSTALALPARNATEAMAMLMNFIVDKNSQGGLLMSMEMDLNGFYASNNAP